jgi:UDP-GlcNAc:undecaprenyl-phosphate GlcNAc-1-phosphate transferase
MLFTPPALHLLTALGAAGVALVATLVSVPLLERIGHAYGWLDHPDQGRRLHTAAVPRLGGVGIAAGVVAAVAFAAIAARQWGSAQPFAWPPLIGLAWGAAIVFAVGVADDLSGVPPWQKLAAQTVAALIAVAFGATVQSVTIQGVGTLSMGLLGVPITLLWMVGLSNAFNLIDGMDGLAGGVGLIATATVMVSAALLGQWPVVVVGGALLGALVGFLRFNRHPARIFLGDSGSLAIGFALAVLSITGAREPSGAVHLLVPLAALTYPLVDTGVAIVRRYLRGHPYSRADGRHVHHQLYKLGLGVPRTVRTLWALSACAAVGGVTLAFAPPKLALAVAGVLAVLLGTAAVYGLRWLGYDEFLEASDSFASAARKARDVIRYRIQARELTRQVRDAPSLESVRALLGSQAPELGFEAIEVVQLTQRAHEAGVLPRDPAEGPWCLECPVRVAGEDGRQRTVVLRFWVARERGGSAVNAERIAARLVPALEQWMAAGAEAGRRDDEPTPRRVTPY